jgi:hypothetical protein
MAALLVATSLIVATSTAWAFWLGGSVLGGNGAAAATSVSQGATPTASAIGQAITVTWAPSTLTNGQAVTGYLVMRYDAGTLAPQTMLTACTGTVTATSCTEGSVPQGSWKYTVTPLIGASWRGAESAKSSAVSSTSPDTTPPTNSITLSAATGDAARTGSTIYYRGVAAGSFTLSNAVNDAGSGPASSSTAALGGTATGWSHTPSTVSTPAGGPYVSNAFSWTAGTTSAPTEVVTGRDAAGNSTATSPQQFLNDSTAPTAGTISYLDGDQSGLSVQVTFTTGTDAGSGIARRQLQRKSAPLVGGACGTWTGFTNLGAVNPTSIYTDTTVATGTCYQYAYVVTDLVNNQNTATSASIVKVSYSGAVSTTTGLLSYWRLGENAAALGSSDSFTTGTGTGLTTRAGETGATWAFQGGTSSTLEQISSEKRAYRNGAGYSINYTTATPPSADYSVEADLYVKSTLIGDMAGVVGRLNTTTNQFYMARWEAVDSSWNIVQYDNGTPSYPAFVASQPALVVGQVYRIRLEMSGTTTTTLKLYVNGVLTLSTTDSTAPVLTAAGKAGIMDGSNLTSVTKSSVTGLHFDDFQVTPATYPRAADSKGSNPGDYKNGVTLGTTGALAGSTNTAATFDGVNDYVQVTGSTGIPTGAGQRSVEMWFTTSSSARQVLFDYGNVANTQEFGLWLDAGGATMSAWGFGNGNDKVFTLPTAVNNGSWHQVVETYNGTTLTLYVDGVGLPSQAATRATAMDAYGFGIGAIIHPGDGNSGGYFTGSLDEVSFYTTVLSQATVTNHYQLGAAVTGDTTGPTGGSVDATGLVGTGTRYAASTTLSLLLAKGTDPSGVAASGAQLERATGTLTSSGTADGVCGSYGAFTLITGGTDPASPAADTVADQACYRYRYSVQDTLGNPTSYTSADIKVDQTAPAAPSLTVTAPTNVYWSGSGSTVYYRSTASTGTFTLTAGSTDTASGITGYSFPSLGANWTSTPGALGVNVYSWSGAPAAPGTRQVTATNNATVTSANSPLTLTDDTTAPTAGSVTYPNGSQTSTSLSVTFTTGTDAGAGIGTRLLQRASATLTGSTCGTYGTFSTVAGGTNPASPFTDTLSTGNCYEYQYVVSDNVGNLQTATSASVVKVTSSYFNTVFATAGLISYYRLGEALPTSPVTDSKGTNSGTYLNTPTMGVPGAITADSDTAVQFDGLSEYASITRQISNDFSIEFWFKSTQGIGTGTQWWNGAGLVDAEVSGGFNDFGVSLRSDGRVVAGVGTPDVSIVSSSGGYNNGTWHHVVLTRTKVTGALALYVDGVAAGTATGSTASLTTAVNINFGRIQSGSNYYQGALDEVAIYSTPLSAATVTAHYSAR